MLASFLLVSARVAQHGKDGRRRAKLDRGHDLEAMSLVKGGILQIRGPEVCRAVLPVALAKAVLQKSRTTPFVPVQGFDANER